MRPGAVDAVITSPPYWGQRDYGNPDQIGRETTPEEYVSVLRGVFSEVFRVLSDAGTLWLNIGDVTHRGQLLGLPWRVAFALQSEGWRLRQDLIWSKPNPMPGAVRGRCITSHEYFFLFSKSPRYYYDEEAVKEPAVTGGTRHKRSVWVAPVASVKEAHFATYPPGLIRPAIVAATSARGHCRECGAGWVRVVEKDRQPTRPGRRSKIEGETPATAGKRDRRRHTTRTKTTGWVPGCPCGAPARPGIILDPFGGSGSTAIAAGEVGRDSVTVEINPDYAGLAKRRIDYVG